MTKFLAHCFLIVAGLVIMLGNYWFTFGLWPQSWVSFVVFGMASLTLILLRTEMEK